MFDNPKHVGAIMNVKVAVQLLNIYIFSNALKNSVSKWVSFKGKLKCIMDNEKSSKLRHKQCYFRKWTDGYRRTDLKIKNNVGSQSRGAEMRYNRRTCFSYSSARFLTSWRYYKSTTEKTWITFLGILMTCRAVLAILLLLSVHTIINMKPFRKICRTSYIFSMMSEIPGKLKIGSKIWLICFKTFLYKYLYYKLLKNLLKPKQWIQHFLKNTKFLSVKSVIIVL